MTEKAEKRLRVPRGAGRPKHMKDGEVRESIRNAAVALFAEKGFDATSMQDVADRAGATKPMIYYYFKDKTGLLGSILEWSHQARLASINEIVGMKTLPVIERFRRLLDWQQRAFIEHPEMVRFFHRLLAAPPKALAAVGCRPRVWGEVFDALLELTRQGIEGRELSGDPETITALLHGILHFTPMLYFHTERAELLERRWADEMFTATLQGIASRNTTSPQRKP